MKLSISALLVVTFASSCNAMYLKWVNVSRPPVPSDYTGYVRPWYFAKLGDVTATGTVEPDLELMSYLIPLITVGIEFDEMTLPYTTDASIYDGSKTVEAFNDPLPFSTPLITEPGNWGPAATLAVDFNSDILMPLAEKVADSIEPLTDMLDEFSQPFKQVPEYLDAAKNEANGVSLGNLDPFSGSLLELSLDVTIENPLAFLESISKRESINGVSETDVEEELGKRGELGQEIEAVYIDLSLDDFERGYPYLGSLLKKKRGDDEIYEGTKTVTPSIDRLPFVTSSAGEIVDEARRNPDVEEQAKLEKRFKDLFAFGASLVPQGGFAVDTKGNTQFGLNYEGNPIADATKAIIDGIPPLPSLKPLNELKPLNVLKLFDWLIPKGKRGDDQYKTTSFEATRARDRVLEDRHNQDEILTCEYKPRKLHTRRADLLVTNEKIPSPADAEDSEKYLPD